MNDPVYKAFAGANLPTATLRDHMVNDVLDAASWTVANGGTLSDLLTNRMSFAKDADLVLADKVQIQQVVLNLVRNAIEAMEGSPRRELVVSAKALPDAMRQVSVADTGSGLAPVLIDQLFKPFQTTKAQGSRPVDFPHHHRGPRGPHMGRAQPRRRDDLPLHDARRSCERTRRP